MAAMVGTMARARRGTERDDSGDPLQVARRALRKRGVDAEPIDLEARREVEGAVTMALSREASHA